MRLASAQLVLAREHGHASWSALVHATEASVASFVVAATRSPAGARRLAALVELVHAYDLQAVAEGVEDDAQLQSVRACGVDLLQGYHLGAPAPWEPAVLPPQLLAPRSLPV